MVRLNIKINKDKLFNKFSKSDECLEFAKNLFIYDDFDIDDDLNFKSELGKIHLDLNDFKTETTTTTIKTKRKKQLVNNIDMSMN